MAKNYSDKSAPSEAAPSKPEELETPAPTESTGEQAPPLAEEKTPEPEPEKAKTQNFFKNPIRPKKIISEEQAVDYVRSFFNVPDGIKTVWVCEDTNIFYRGNPAEVHAKEQNLKLFAIRWD